MPTVNCNYCRDENFYRQEETAFYSRHAEVSQMKNEISGRRDIKNIIFLKEVSAKLIFVAGAGLPNSGTTSLIKGIVNPENTEQTFSPHKLKIYSTALFKSTVENDGHVIHLVNEDEHDGMLLLALVKLLVNKQFVWLHDKPESDKTFFDDGEVNNFFICFCERLFALFNEVKDLSLPSAESDRKSPLVALTKSQNFINFLDITVNKAVYECLFILGRCCTNGVLLCVLDLFHYTGEVLDKKLDLKDDYFEGKYREEDAKHLKIHTAYNFLKAIFEGTFGSKESRAILVCTNTDKCSDVTYRQHQLQVEYPLDVAKIVCISNKDEECHSRVRKMLIHLIENSLEKYKFVQLKYMFFYYILKKLNKILLDMKDIEEYGDKCELSSGDIEQCLTELHDGCFLFRIGDFVILKIADFMADIEKLYYCKEDEGSSVIKSGVVSRDLCEKLWGSSSTGHCNAYISILISTGLMVELKGVTCTYFLPSLRSEYSIPSVNHDSSSLFIYVSPYLPIPFHMQCKFVKYFQSKFEKAEVVDECQYYNVLKMTLSNHITLSITFDRTRLEVSLKFNGSKSDNDFRSIKNACADILEQIREGIPDLRYKFAVSCACCQSEDHLFVFNGSCNVTENLKCRKCLKTIKAETWGEKKSWVHSACESFKLHKNDKLNTDTIYDIAGKLSSSDSVHLICEILENFEKKMKEKSSITKDEVSASALPSKDKKHMLFHGLYNWYLYTRKDSISELAKFIRSHGYNKEADIIYPYFHGIVEPELEFPLPYTSEVTSQEVHSISDWWDGSTAVLAGILKIDPIPSIIAAIREDQKKNEALLSHWVEINSGIDQRNVIYDIFYDASYALPREVFSPLLKTN